MVRCAIYARYSSDNQREASIEDQLRICREHAEKLGWHVVESYADHATSGANLLRPGIQRLLADASASMVDIILAESLDRLSRDQEDTAAIFKRLGLPTSRSSRFRRARSLSCMSALTARCRNLLDLL